MKHTYHTRSTIAVYPTTRNLMRKVARKEQTYDDLINELIEFKQLNAKEIQN